MVYLVYGDWLYLYIWFIGYLYLWDSVNIILLFILWIIVDAIIPFFFINIIDLYYREYIRNSMKKQIYSLLSLILILNLVALTLAGGAIVINPGCKQFDSSGLCSSCSNIFYKDKDGICQPVSSTCKTYKT